MQPLKQLILTAKMGDLDSFGELVHRFQDMVYARAFALLGDHHLAQDAAQEAFIEAYLNLPKLNHPEAFIIWLRQIIFKHSHRLIRGQSLTQVPLETVHYKTSPNANPSYIAERRQIQFLVRQAITDLPESQSLVTELFYLGGYPQKDIAAMLNLPLSTIKKRLYTARKTLKERMLVMEDYVDLKNKRPSQSKDFSESVQFFLALRTGNLDKVEAMLKANPKLVNTPRAKDEDSQRDLNRYYYTILSGTTPLYWAAGKGNLALVKLLHQYGAEINQNGRGTALNNAVSMNQTEVVKYLLKQGADPKIGQPLLMAVIKGSKDVCTLLLKHGAEVNVSTNTGWTPLHWAAQKGNYALTNLLLQYGADKTAKDQKGQSPLDIAQAQDHPQIVTLLKDETNGKGSIPVGQRTLGRLLGWQGQILDQAGPLADGPVWPITYPEPVNSDKISIELWETGIKVIDLLAPLPKIGLFSLYTPFAGVGKLVTLFELMHRFYHYLSGQLLCLGSDINTHEIQDWSLVFRESQLNEKVAVLLVQQSDPPIARQDLLKTALTMTNYNLRLGQQNTFLTITGDAISPEQIAEFQPQFAAKQSGYILACLFGTDDISQTLNLDAQISFNLERAQAYMYPALDILGITSKCLTEELVGANHVEVAQQVRSAFEGYQNLQTTITEKGLDGLSGADRDLALRVRRLDRFFTQPFFTSEPFTQIPGTYVSRQETVQTCRDILAGRYDDVPEEAFYFTGSMEQVLEKAKL